MVIKTLNNYMLDNMVDRIKTLQTALNQAELIIGKLEKENESLKDVLVSLASDNQGYNQDRDIFDEPLCVT